jgi:NAD(P)H dehydrogenase (quinone)
MAEILVVYFSRHGSVREMARLITRGASSVPGVNTVIRSVPPVSTEHTAVAPDVPDEGDPFVETRDLEQCDGLLLGSPIYFGNMAAPVKHFLDSTSALWVNGDLVNKPAGVFGASSSMHGGQESGLLSMLLPLMHQGMVIAGLPYTEKALNTTTGGGTPYGASHVAGAGNSNPITPEERELCIALGKRIAVLSISLSAGG